jgi:hypothetical protein
MRCTFPKNPRIHRSSAASPTSSVFYIRNCRFSISKDFQVLSDNSLDFISSNAFLFLSDVSILFPACNPKKRRKKLYMPCVCVCTCAKASATTCMLSLNSFTQSAKCMNVGANFPNVTPIHRTAAASSCSSTFTTRGLFRFRSSFCRDGPTA